MKQTSMGRAKRVLLLALLLLSAGCGQRDTIATTLVTPTSIDPTVLAAALATTRTIYISDDWVGLDSSQYAHWNLERVDGRASGQAKLSAKARSGVAHEAAPTIDIPSLSVDNFLQMLATVQYEPGVRGLASQATITLSTDAGMVEFAFKTNSGDFIRPGEKERIGWSLVFKGQDYLISPIARSTPSIRISNAMCCDSCTRTPRRLSTLASHSACNQAAARICQRNRQRQYR